MKSQIKEWLKEKKLFVIDVGVESADRPLDTDPNPPIIRVVREAVECVIGSPHFAGILICANGIATSIYANRFKKIRAALCRSVDDARLSRQDNDVNVLCLGAETTDIETAKKIVNTFLTTRALDVMRYRRRQKLFDL